MKDQCPYLYAVLLTVWEGKKRNPLNTAVSLLFKHRKVPFKTINCNILSLKAPNIIYIKTFRNIVVRETFIINKISILKVY